MAELHLFKSNLIGYTSRQARLMTLILLHSHLSMHIKHISCMKLSLSVSNKDVYFT
jgi:hypothetical protein